MSNPFSVAALATYPKGPAQGTDNVTSLANNTAKGLGAVGTTVVQYADDIVAPIRVKTGSGTSGSGTIELHLVVSEDSSVGSNGIDPDATSDQSSKMTANTLIEALQANADTTSYYFKGVNLQALRGGMPTYWALVLYNKSGATLSATAADHYAKHSQVSYA
jgi:hypothetical protein